MTTPCIPAGITGEVPLAMYLGAKPSDEDGGFYAQRFGWLGCLDATEQVAAGSTLPVYIPTDIGGLGYEGNVSRIAVRP